VRGEPFIYRDNGERERFTPARACRRLAGCLLCGARIVCVATFEPHDDTTRNAVLRLRQRPLRPCSSPGLLYGLCAEHTDEVMSGDRRRVERLVAHVEDILIALAARVRLH
jgi:hypothetical protein